MSQKVKVCAGSSLTTPDSSTPVYQYRGVPGFTGDSDFWRGTPLYINKQGVMNPVNMNARKGVAKR